MSIDLNSPTLLELIRFFQSKQDRYRFLRFPLWAALISEEEASSSSRYPPGVKFGFDALVRLRSVRLDGICLELHLEQGVIQVRHDNDVIPVLLDAPISALDGALHPSWPRIGIVRGLLQKDTVAPWNRIRVYAWDVKKREFESYDGSYVRYAKTTLFGDKEEQDPDTKPWWTLVAGMRTRDDAFTVQWKDSVFVVASDGPSFPPKLAAPRETDVPDATHSGTYEVLCEQLEKEIGEDYFSQRVTIERMVELVQVPSLKIKDTYKADTRQGRWERDHLCSLCHKKRHDGYSCEGKLLC
jgi:hypothetical protein